MFSYIPKGLSMWLVIAALAVLLIGSHFRYELKGIFIDVEPLVATEPPPVQKPSKPVKKPGKKPPPVAKKPEPKCWQFEWRFGKGEWRQVPCPPGLPG